ncbi:hypothetical protein E0485_02550 [Paenibacillus albiflavus]|uniref:Cell wall elongation regulator TseB-like domain-containing protein n=1 Tax=Paenibacillus albiflavus TaxID=2545760 RepID=A0A4R4ERJ9_9BACL|nr:DUF5590 domain-containing protein [Paenibacillus albiflavus]TCZ81175.1 hypothetical protein E0485_02550 [Paenibacillus albiflavus]
MRSLRSSAYSKMSRPKKILWIAILVFVVLIIALSFFYASVQKDYFAERDRAMIKAKEELSLNSVTRSEPSYGDEAYQIVFGTDAGDRPVVVWVSDSNMIVEQADGAFTKEDVNRKVLEQEPTATILRTLPNRIQGVNVWEAFFEKPGENGKPSYFYMYYRFRDGEYVDTYKLSH